MLETVGHNGTQNRRQGREITQLSDKCKNREYLGWGQDPHTCSLGHTLISKHLPAVGTEEMLGVPGLLQGREDFLQEKPR